MGWTMLSRWAPPHRPPVKNVCGGHAGSVIGLSGVAVLPYGSVASRVLRRDTSDSRHESTSPRSRPGRALAHTPHRSDGRPPHAPRGERPTGQNGRPGTLPPVPGRPILFSSRVWLLLPLLAAAGCALLTWQVAVHGPLLSADRRLSTLLMAHSPGRRLAELGADLGNPQVALPVFLAAVAYAWWRGRDLPQLLRCLAAAALVPVVVLTVKDWLDRPGPVPGTGFGYYPSGHAATTLVAFGAAALLLLPHLRRRSPVLTALLGLTLLNGFGLMWRGYHWPVDVLASWCLGVLLLTWPALYCRPGSAAARPPS